MSEYLSAKELHDVTDYARSAQQVAWLKSLGLFDDAEAAHTAYVEAKRKQHVGCTI